MFSYSLSYMVRVISCNLAWILEPVKFSLLPLIYKFWTFFVNPSLMLFLFVTTHNLSLADTLMLCVIVSEGLLLSFKLLKEPKLFQILSWFFSVSSTLFRFLRLKLSFKLLCYFFTDWQSLPTFFKHRMVMNNVRSSERSDIKYWYYDWMPFPTYKGLDQCDCESSLEETPECNLFIMGQHSTFDRKFFWVAIFTTTNPHKRWCDFLIHSESCPCLTFSSLFCRQGTIPCPFSAARVPSTLRHSHFASSLTTVFSDPDLHSSYSKFQVSWAFILFQMFCSEAEALCNISWQILRWSIVSLSPSNQAGGPHLVVCLRLLPSTCSANLHICRQSPLWQAHI